VTDNEFDENPEDQPPVHALDELNELQETEEPDEEDEDDEDLFPAIERALTVSSVKKPAQPAKTPSNQHLNGLSGPEFMERSRTTHDDYKSRWANNNSPFVHHQQNSFQNAPSMNGMQANSVPLPQFADIPPPPPPQQDNNPQSQIRMMRPAASAMNIFSGTGSNDIQPLGRSATQRTPHRRQHSSTLANVSTSMNGKNGSSNAGNNANGKVPHKRHSSTLANLSATLSAQNEKDKDKDKKIPVIKQSKSADDPLQSQAAKEPDDAKRNSVEERRQRTVKENEDWQIMGDLLFSIRHALISQMRGDKFKKRPKGKAYMDVKEYQWNTFVFKEYAPTLFSEMRGKWLGCKPVSDTYVKRLFGETSASVPVKDLDINKSCKYYWRRISTNSKSGQVFFQTVNGEYMIKSMPRSEADFFRRNFLGDFYDHMMKQEDSLLMHIMGCYKIQYTNAKLEMASNNEYNSKRKQDVNKGVYVIVMKSILFCEMTPTVRMHKIYDLKGSTHNRTASRYKLNLDQVTFDALNEVDEKAFEQEVDQVAATNDEVKRIAGGYSSGFYTPRKNENLEKFKSDRSDESSNHNGDENSSNNNQAKQGQIVCYKRSKVLKDMDFLHDGERVRIGDKLKAKYLRQLRIDLDFLIKMNVMDYSLLVGIHRLNESSNLNKKAGHRRQHSLVKPKRPKPGSLFTFEFGGMCAEKIMFDAETEEDKEKATKKDIYFTGIIDFLQKYNAKKQMESVYKSLKVKGGKDAISSVDAKTYANRLYEFIEKRVD